MIFESRSHVVQVDPELAILPEMTLNPDPIVLSKCEDWRETCATVADVHTFTLILHEKWLEAMMRRTAQNKCVGKILQLETGIVIKSTAGYIGRQLYVVQARMKQALKAEEKAVADSVAFEVD